jgi:hypothetical protein
MTVLILSAVTDVHAQAVMDILAAQGAEVELVDLSEFPIRLALSLAFGGDRRRFELRRHGGGVLDLDSVSAVWWRRPQPFRLPAAMDQAYQHFALSETATAFQGLYQALDAFWVNDPARNAMAEHKPYQLDLAQKIGLDIPVTLMTNDAEEARAFWREPRRKIQRARFATGDHREVARTDDPARSRLWRNRPAADSRRPLRVSRHQSSWAVPLC